MHITLTSFSLYLLTCYCQTNAATLLEKIREKRQCTAGMGYYQQAPPQQQPQYSQQYTQQSNYVQQPQYQQPSGMFGNMIQQTSPVMGSSSCMQLTQRQDIQDCLEIPTGTMFRIMQNLSWRDAQQACRAVPGAFLASIRNFEEFRAFAAFAYSSQSVWIGLNDQQSEGRYVWSDDNSVVTYNQWIKGFPQGGTQRNCAMGSFVVPNNANEPPFFNMYDAFAGWGDFDCNMLASPLCKIPKTMMG